MSEIKIPKKLIEVALPLDEINAACAHEKMPGIGPHPRGIHLWWARRPLAAARAVIFSQMVVDPSETVGGDKRLRETKLKIQNEREKLFDIIRDLVKWENTNNELVLHRARQAIKDSWQFICQLNKNHPKAHEIFNPEKLPAFHDPFAGGGAIPLEAQRLGLNSFGSDLNPVAVMINKAMIEIPPKFSGNSSVTFGKQKEKQPSFINENRGVDGLVEDIKFYGHWMLNEARKKLGHLYPKVRITEEMARRRPDLKPYLGKELKVIAWLWTRTVKSPSPMFSDVEVPLVRSFDLSNKKGKEAWVKPVIKENSYKFEIELGKRPSSELSGTVARTGGTCIMSNTAIPFKYIREEGKAGRIGKRMLAVVLEGKKSRIYISQPKK